MNNLYSFIAYFTIGCEVGFLFYIFIFFIFFYIFFKKTIDFNVEYCYYIYMVIPLITLIKISIPNTPFERIDFISIIVKLITEVNLTKKELPQALFFYIFLNLDLHSFFFDIIYINIYINVLK